MSTKDKKIKYGKKDLLNEDDFLAHNIKQRISIMIDLDVLEAFKKRAKSQNGKYQTLINQTLRDSILGNKTIGLEKRIERLERLTLKKK